MLLKLKKTAIEAGGHYILGDILIGIMATLGGISLAIIPIAGGKGGGVEDFGGITWFS